MYVAAGLILAAFRLILWVFYVLLLVRAIMSWIPGDMGALSDFVYGITEPVLAPVRSLLDRIGGSSFMPIDWSFLVVMIIITLLLRIV